MSARYVEEDIKWSGQSLTMKNYASNTTSETESCPLEDEDCFRIMIEELYGED